MRSTRGRNRVERRITRDRGLKGDHHTMVRLISAVWRGRRCEYSKHRCMKELKGRVFGQVVGCSLSSGHCGFSQFWHRGKKCVHW